MRSNKYIYFYIIHTRTHTHAETLLLLLDHTAACRRRDDARNPPPAAPFPSSSSRPFLRFPPQFERSAVHRVEPVRSQSSLVSSRVVSFRAIHSAPCRVVSFHHCSSSSNSSNIGSVLDGIICYFILSVFYFSRRRIIKKKKKKVKK